MLLEAKECSSLEKVVWPSMLNRTMMLTGPQFMAHIPRIKRDV
jgi:hypothetical protein